MAVEPRRGCGYRKIGGLYLVSGPQGMPCDRLPYPLEVCPTCNQGIKQARGWTWVDVKALVRDAHMVCHDFDQMLCPMCAPLQERAGLLWIGERFYPTVETFNWEVVKLGISRRIRVIPRGFEIGKTWILLAHPKAVQQKFNVQDPGIFKAWRPSRIEKILPESKRGSEEVAELEKKGIFPVFVPDNDPDHTGSAYGEVEEQIELVHGC